MDDTLQRSQRKLLSPAEKKRHIKALGLLGSRKQVCRICDIHNSSYTHYFTHGCPLSAAVRIKLARERLGLTVEEMREVLEIICPVLVD